MHRGRNRGRHVRRRHWLRRASGTATGGWFPFVSGRAHRFGFRLSLFLRLFPSLFFLSVFLFSFLFLFLLPLLLFLAGNFFLLRDFRKHHLRLCVGWLQKAVGDRVLQQLRGTCVVLLLDQGPRILQLLASFIPLLVALVCFHLRGMKQLRHIRVGPECGQRLPRHIDGARQLLPLNLAANFLNSLMYFPLDLLLLLLVLPFFLGFGCQAAEQLLSWKFLNGSPRQFCRFAEALSLEQPSNLLLSLLGILL